MRVLCVSDQSFTHQYFAIISMINQPWTTTPFDLQYSFCSIWSRVAKTTTRNFPLNFYAYLKTLSIPLKRLTIHMCCMHQQHRYPSLPIILTVLCYAREQCHAIRWNFAWNTVPLAIRSLRQARVLRDAKSNDVVCICNMLSVRLGAHEL